MRQLTKYFGSYNLAKYEKETGKGVMDILDIGNFEITKIANIIRLGNKDFINEEDAYNRLDEYLKSDEEHSLISAYFDLIDELDKDIKILRSCGVRVEDLKAEFKEMASKLGDNLKDKLKETQVNTEINEGSEEVKVESSDEDNKIVKLPKEQ